MIRNIFSQTASALSPQGVFKKPILFQVGRATARAEAAAVVCAVCKRLNCATRGPAYNKKIKKEKNPKIETLPSVCFNCSHTRGPSSSLLSCLTAIVAIDGQKDRGPMTQPMAQHFGLNQARHGPMEVGPMLARPDHRVVPGPLHRHVGPAQHDGPTARPDTQKYKGVKIDILCH